MILRTMFEIAAGPGTITALIVASVFAFAGYTMTSLTYGADASHVVWNSIKGFVFGVWLGYTPFVLYTLFRLLLLNGSDSH